MIRRLIAAAAVSGTLALGVAGVAGASAPTSTPTSTATHATRCAKAEKVATRIQTLETKAATWVPKAQAREAKATAAGHTKLATRIGNRITRVQKREAAWHHVAVEDRGQVRERHQRVVTTAGPLRPRPSRPVLAGRLCASGWRGRRRASGWRVRRRQGGACGAVRR